MSPGECNEAETQTRNSLYDPIPEDIDSACPGYNMTDSMMSDSLEGILRYPDPADQYLSDHHKSQSSSEELLTGSANQSRSGSLERILEHRVMAASPRSRSSSRDRSLSGSSPIKSSEQKTPDTDISDTSLPPPPPDILNNYELGAQAVAPHGTAPVPQHHSEVPSPMHSNVQAPGELPFDHLRQSLRKTRGATAKETEDHENVGSLDSSNVKQVISRYGTIPKGARIGAYLASLKNPEDKDGVVAETSEEDSPDKSPLDNKLSESCGNVAEAVLRMPTPEVRRKVEEWQAGVAKSLTEEQPPSSSPSYPHGHKEKTPSVRSSRYWPGVTKSKKGFGY